MRVSKLVRRLFAGTCAAAAIAMAAPGLAVAAQPPTPAHATTTVVTVNISHYGSGLNIGKMMPNGPGWDGQE